MPRSYCNPVLKEIYSDVSVKKILYSPLNPSITKLMEKVAAKLRLTAQGLPDEQNMILLMQDQKNSLDTLGGVQFDDSLSGTAVLPKTLYAAIRLSAELRKYGKNLSIENTWYTDRLFPSIELAGPRDSSSTFTASPGISKQH